MSQVGSNNERTLQVTYHYGDSLEDPKRKHATDCAMSAMEPLGQQLSQRSKDLFRMKVLSLLERQGIASNHEARDQVRHSPIESMQTQRSGDKCTLTQRLTLFPGQTIIVEGHSAFNDKTKVIDQIFPDSISISMESTQTGYPHPLQRAGWTLANELLPLHIQRPDLLKSLKKVLSVKSELIERLQPKGELIGKAKALLRLKKKAFAAHHDEMVNMHHKLSQAIMKAAGYEDTEPLHNWYRFVKGKMEAFDLLSRANQEWTGQIITKTFKLLQEAIVQGKDTPIGSSDPMMRSAAAEYLISKAFDEVAKEPIVLAGIPDVYASIYCRHQTEIFRSPIQKILLQYFSEDLIYPAPLLNKFEKKVQQALFSHVEDFARELFDFEVLSDEDPTDWCYKRMKRFLEKDLELFSSDAPCPYAADLEQYFAKRYATLSFPLRAPASGDYIFPYIQPTLDL